MRRGTTYAAPSIENCEFKMVCSSCENSGHLSVAVAQFTVAEEADLITAELSRECLDSAHRTLPVLQNRRFADPQLCD